MEITHCKISKDITICGFVDLLDVASPPSVSRHLVLPVHSNRTNDVSLNSETGKIQEIDSVEEENNSGSEEGKNPSFCVLLHGALKVNRRNILEMILL